MRRSLCRAVLSLAIWACGPQPAPRPAPDSTARAVAEYLAIRRPAVDAIDAHLFGGAPIDPQYANEPAIHDDLERRVRAIIGPIDLPGFPQPGKFSLVCLCKHEEDSELIDGIVYRDSSWSHDLLVTTPGLLTAWGEDHKLKPGRLSIVDSILRTPDILDDGIAGGSAIYWFADIAIPHAAERGVVTAMLILRAQDYGPWPPNRLLIAVNRGGRIYIVQAKTIVPIQVLGVCKAAVDSAFDAQRRAGRTPQQMNDTGEAIYAKYRACYNTHVNDIPGIEKIRAQAEALIDALPH